MKLIKIFLLSLATLLVFSCGKSGDNSWTSATGSVSDMQQLQQLYNQISQAYLNYGNQGSGFYGVTFYEQKWKIQGNSWVKNGDHVQNIAYPTEQARLALLNGPLFHPNVEGSRATYVTVQGQKVIYFIVTNTGITIRDFQVNLSLPAGVNPIQDTTQIYTFKEGLTSDILLSQLENALKVNPYLSPAQYIAQSINSTVVVPNTSASSAITRTLAPYAGSGSNCHTIWGFIKVCTW